MFVTMHAMRIMRKTVTLLHLTIAFFSKRILIGLHTQTLIWVNYRNLMTIFILCYEEEAIFRTSFDAWE